MLPFNARHTGRYAAPPGTGRNRRAPYAALACAVAGALLCAATGCQAILGIKDPVVGAGADAAAPSDGAAPKTDGAIGTSDGGAGKLDGGSAFPPLRSDAAMVYDAACRCVVLFGGSGTSGPLDDTWEWDGTRWHNVTPASGNPPPRSDHVMAYDASRKRVVLFGGDGGTNMPLNDTWEWDGKRWTEITPASPVPEGRFWATMAYDAAIGQVVLFGGETFQGHLQTSLGDTWEWDGHSWTEPNDGTSGAPEARSGAAMVYDTKLQKIVLFGGNGHSSGALNDTWTWDGATWTNVTPSSGNPTPRQFAQTAYDESRHDMVLFAGNDKIGNPLDDTWEWDGTGWSEVTPASGNPPGGEFAEMAYDGVNQRVLFFDINGGMWEWDDTGWSAL